MAHFLIVGQSLKAFKRYLTEQGHTYTLFQDRLKTKFPEKRFKNRVVVDFSSKEKIIEAVNAIDKKIDGSITTYENYIVANAWICEFLKLPGLSVRSAEACTDKYLMRTLFSKAPKSISPAFAEVSSEEDVKGFALRHTFPIILKPANLAKSLLVTKSNSLEELLHNYRQSLSLLSGTYKKYASNRTPKLIIEEFLEGSIHSIDAFVDSQGEVNLSLPIVDYQTGYDIGFEDNFHYSRILPSKLSSEKQKALRKCAEIGVKALGIKSSPAHIEIIMTQNGPRIVEIGARNGGYRERMHSLANGVDTTNAALSLALGRPIEIVVTKNDFCAVLELFPKTPGIFHSISNEGKLKKLSSLKYYSVKSRIGDYVGKAADGYKMCAVIILSSDNKESFIRELDFVNKEVRVITTD